MITVKARDLRIGDELVTFGWTIGQRRTTESYVGVSTADGKRGTAFPLDLDVQVKRAQGPSGLSEQWRHRAHTNATELGTLRDDAFNKARRAELSARFEVYRLCAIELEQREQASDDAINPLAMVVYAALGRWAGGESFTEQAEAAVRAIRAMQTDLAEDDPRDQALRALTEKWQRDAEDSGQNGGGGVFDQCAEELRRVLDGEP